MADRFGNMGGVGKFVAALTGRDAIRQEAQADAWKQADDMARARKLAAESRIAEDELAARGDGLGDALTTLGADPALGVILRAGFGNFQQSTAGMQNLADLALSREAADMARAPNADVETINRILAARVQGGGPLSANEAVAGRLGDALVAKEQARAGTADAQAQAALARLPLIAAQAEAARARAARTLQGGKEPIALGDALTGAHPDGVQFVIDDPQNLPAPVVDALRGGNPEAPAEAPRNERIQQVGGKPVVRVNSKEEARAAWDKLAPGAGLMFPNGTIRWKE